MRNSQKVKVTLYLLGITIIILNRVASFLDYNSAMTVATLLLVVTFLMDAYHFYQEKKNITAMGFLLLSIVISLLLVYLWIYKI